MSRKKKLINNTNIPQHAIESMARCFLPSILEFYQSEEGQREYAEWKAQREETKARAANTAAQSVKEPLFSLGKNRGFGIFRGK